MDDTRITITMTAKPAAPLCGEPVDLYFTVTNTTDNPVDVHSVKFKLDKGGLPTDLAQDYSNVTVVAPEGWTLRQSAQNFTGTPNTPDHAAVGGEGVQFSILGIVVNDDPGLTQITMEHTCEGDTDPVSQQQGLNKILPPLCLYDMNLDPVSALYGGQSVVSWDASIGAVITLDIDGTPVDHVKDQPAQPLPSKGSYGIANILKRTPVTVTAAAGPSSDSEAVTQLQKTITIVPATGSLACDVTRPAGGLPQAVLTWSSKSAGMVALTSEPAGLSVPTVPLQGSMPVPFVLPTTFTQTVSNPAHSDTSAASQKALPPAFDWVPVGAGPLAPAEMGQVFETHMGLVLARNSTPADPGGFWHSVDGIHWTALALPPQAATNMPMSFATHGGTTYLSAGPVQNAVFFSTTDLVTWTQTPAPPFKHSLVPPVITCDDSGTVWALSAGSGIGVWKSADGMQSWVSLGEPETLNCGLLTCWRFMGGKLWAVGATGLGAGSTSLFSSADGAVWVEHACPAGLDGAPSINGTVFNDEICVFVCPTSGQPAVPMAMWRINSAGVWTEDAATAGQTMTASNKSPISVAQTGGTLFAFGNGSFTPTPGVWARNT